MVLVILSPQKAIASRSVDGFSDTIAPKSDSITKCCVTCQRHQTERRREWAPTKARRNQKKGDYYEHELFYKSAKDCWLNHSFFVLFKRRLWAHL
ncbi:MAG: hypothetical protein DRR19_27480 [Candidatus Parabeggiatoa sp. nov. 1]|nr:MAG: hypothetical protein DRR19_27480 [Gammaproteobacteria bacterium]